MTDTNTLYDTDFLRWTEEQAAALRGAQRSHGSSNLPLDWENLAEEIESLGVSQRTALRSQLRRIMRHLFKLEASTAVEPRPGWEESVGDARAEIEDILQDSPSLRRELPGMVAEQTPRAAKLASRDLERHGEAADGIATRLGEGGFTVDGVLGDWFPEKNG
jgi:hypothetical protein